MLTGFGQSEPALEGPVLHRSHDCQTMEERECAKDSLDAIMKGEWKLGE